MIYKYVSVIFTAVCFLAAPISGHSATVRATLTVAEIVSRNVAARGGLQAWRAVQTLTMRGTLGVGGDQRKLLPVALPDRKAGTMPTDVKLAEEARLPFVLEMQRPLKTRFEVQFKGQTAVQAFDGEKGWKLRPFLNRNEVEPYTAEETRKASLEAALDGPLIDYMAKGTVVTLDGMEQVEDRNTYKLSVTPKGGTAMHIWVDATTFLETKLEGRPRRLDGVDHAVEISYREYRSINGLQIPLLIETNVLPAAVVKETSAPGTKARLHAREAAIRREDIRIEKVVVNPKLEASLFVMPAVASPASDK